MKNSKLDAFKLNELKTNDQKMTLIGGVKDGTTQYCKEETSGGSDSAIESWPDEGGEVSRLTIYSR